VDSVVCFVNIYPLDSDLSGGWRYPAFEQLGPGVCKENNLTDDLVIFKTSNFKRRQHFTIRGRKS